MAFEQNDLAAAFREDHAHLREGFHKLSRQLRDGDNKGIFDTARRLDEEAGAHIAFEEGDFYPLLADHLGRDAVKQMFVRHAVGYGVLKDVLEHTPDHPITENLRESLQYRSEAMEDHISECGELYATMGRISNELQLALFRRLAAWREKRPSWTQVKKQNAS